MSKVLKKIHAINQLDKDVVIGYAKNVQKLLKTQQIPMAITYLCLLYFYETDYFYKAGMMMNINDKGDILEALQQSTCYGKLDIGYHLHFNKLILSWTFKIIQFSPLSRNSLCIGIDSSNRRHYDYFFANFNDYSCLKNLFYAVTNEGFMYTVFGASNKGTGEWRQGDTIKMELNAQEGQLRYFVNDKDIGNVFDIPIGENMVYNLAVFAGDQDTKIQLVSFEKRLT